MADHNTEFMMLALLLAISEPATVVADEARIRARAQPVLDRFHAAVRGCGARPPFKPTLRIAQETGIIHYDPPLGQVVLYPWSVMQDEPGPVALRESGAVGPGDASREYYEDVFNDLLVAHELSHWLQGFQPEPRTAANEYDGWFLEYDANRIMLAFWREHPSPGRPSEARLARWMTVSAAEPNAVPPPTGMAVEVFFNTERMKIVRGGAYGWYQMLMTRRANAEQPQPSFCALVGRWLPLRDD